VVFLAFESTHIRILQAGNRALFQVVRMVKMEAETAWFPRRKKVVTCLTRLCCELVDYCLQQWLDCWMRSALTIGFCPSFCSWVPWMIRAPHSSAWRSATIAHEYQGPGNTIHLHAELRACLCSSGDCTATNPAAQAPNQREKDAAEAPCKAACMVLYRTPARTLFNSAQRQLG
jgi:hypothetical protein